MQIKKISRNGFTLIELLIVIAVIGVLAAIAIPNYTEYVTRSKIMEATSVLSDTRARMEQYFQDNRTYVGACVAGTLAPKPADTPNFRYTCPTLTANGYRILATGTGSMAGFVYDIYQDNSKTTVGVGTGWSGSGSNCWVVRKNGSC